jgi:hypothetical protein
MIVKGAKSTSYFVTLIFLSAQFNSDKNLSVMKLTCLCPGPYTDRQNRQYQSIAERRAHVPAFIHQRGRFAVGYQ